MAIYTNITSSPTETTLITRGSNVSGNIKKISMLDVSGFAAVNYFNKFR